MPSVHFVKNCTTNRYLAFNAEGDGFEEVDFEDAYPFADGPAALSAENWAIDNEARSFRNRIGFIVVGRRRDDFQIVTYHLREMTHDHEGGDVETGEAEEHNADDFDLIERDAA